MLCFRNGARLTVELKRFLQGDDVVEDGVVDVSLNSVSDVGEVGVRGGLKAVLLGGCPFVGAIDSNSLLFCLSSRSSGRGVATIEMVEDIVKSTP